MIIDTIQCRNLDKDQKDSTAEYIERSLRDFGIQSDIFLERTACGSNRGRIHAKSKWGIVHAMAEADSMEVLCLLLQSQIKAKVLKQKSKAGGHRNRVPFYLPNHDFITSKFMVKPLNKEQMFADFYSGRILKSLVVDDDIESLLFVDSALRKLGVETSFASGEDEAVSKISSEYFDLIILDWELGPATGADILRRSMKHISENSGLADIFHTSPPKIVTYSGHQAKNIVFAKSTGHYFDYIDHWGKPIKYNEMESRASQIVSKISA